MQNIDVFYSGKLLPERPPTPNEIFVLFSPPSYDLPDTALDYLAPSDKSRLEKITSRVLRKQFIQTRLLLRLALEKITSIPAQKLRFAHDPFGKPYFIDNPSLHFNISHSVDAGILIAFASDPVGVDLESFERKVSDPMKFAKRFFHPNETSYLQSLPVRDRQKELLRLWVRKEAVAKCVGSGFQLGYDRFSVLTSPVTIPSYTSEKIVSFTNLSLESISIIGVSAWLGTTTKNIQTSCW